LAFDDNWLVLNDMLFSCKGLLDHWKFVLLTLLTMTAWIQLSVFINVKMPRV